MVFQLFIVYFIVIAQYLKFLGLQTKIYSVVENDGCYEYNASSNALSKVPAATIANQIRTQTVDYSIDPDKKFVPSNYLVPPFNSSEKFLNGEYFLTPSQQRIKSEVQTTLSAYPFAYFCLSANAGTGKTLLLYDMAKEQISQNEQVLIIHCGKLNEGHLRLRDSHGWNIIPIKRISEFSVSSYLSKCSMVFIDEAQRIRPDQLAFILETSKEKAIPIIFSYDTKQYLRSNEGLDLSDYLGIHYPEVHSVSLRLTNKIRTNKEMASFITNLFHIGKSADHLDYECVTIDYIENLLDLAKYIEFLKESGWTALTYTTAQYGSDPYNELICVGNQNAHDVIGQEFPKIVFVMNNNFRYDASGKLTAGYSYYSSKGMLYQIVTRVIDELKIVVFKNPELYLKLLEIKSLGN